MNSSNRTRKLALIGFTLMLTGSAQFVVNPADFSVSVHKEIEAEPVRRLQNDSGHGHHTGSESLEPHEALEMAFPAELLAGLAPTDMEAAAYMENRTGWHRTLPVAEGRALEVVVNHYSERSGNLIVRAQLDGDGLSLLTLVVAGSYVKGHLTIPGKVDYEVTNSGETVTLRPLNDVNWSCGHS